MNKARSLVTRFANQVTRKIRRSIPPKNVVECLVEAAQRELEGKALPFEVFHTETFDQHRIRVLDGLKAIKERYQDEFGIYAGFAPHVVPEKAYGAVQCDHEYIFENRWRETAQIKNISVLRVGATCYVSFNR
jgi:GAF domain-containing protein